MTDVLQWRFLHPWFLVLLPLPLIWLAWHLRGRARNHPSLLYSSLTPFAVAGKGSLKVAALRFMPWMRCLALLLGVVALARPQYGQVERHQASLGLDIALAIDVSESMTQRDFTPNRLEAAKNVVRNFVAGRESDRISLVIFGTTAAVLTPPTFDQNSMGTFINTIRFGLLDGQRTAVGMGLAMAVDRLKDSQAKSKVVILLTDGENNAGTITPQQAAEIAKALDVRVYTIGVGSQGMFRGALDEDSLRHIAQATGGRYFRASSEDALIRIYEEIDKLEKTEIEVSEYADFEERFQLLWAPALALLLLEFLLRGFWLVRVP